MPTFRAGIPAHTSPAGTDLSTTALAPITAPLPMTRVWPVLSNTFAPAPMTTSSSTTILPISPVVFGHLISAKIFVGKAERYTLKDLHVVTDDSSPADDQTDRTVGKAESLSYRDAGRDLNTEQLQSLVGQQPSPAPPHHLDQALLGSETIRAFHKDDPIESGCRRARWTCFALSDLTEVAAMVTTV